MDKNLRAHGLIQAYSRTNRILNSVKAYGNIISFRDLEQATNDALALFGNKGAKGIVLLKPYADYYAEYEKRVAELVALFPLGKAIIGEAAQKAFIKLFGSILRLKNILTAFDDFAGNEILSERDFQDYQSLYLNLYAEFRSVSEAEKETINDDVIFVRMKRMFILHCAAFALCARIMMVHRSNLLNFIKKCRQNSSML